MFHLFVINPAAGLVNPEQYRSVICEKCSRHGLNFEVKESLEKGGVTKIIREAASSYKEITVYSIGGDGTLYEAVNGLAASGNEEAILVPVPCGSGNDFIRTFGYDKQEKFEILLERVLKHSVREVDAVKINDDYGINISSVGFDANVVINAINLKKKKFIPNKMSYTLSVFLTFITQGSYDVKVYLDDKELPYDKILLTAVANGQYYGGGMKPVPSALIDDGLLDILLVEKVRKLTILRFFPKYKKGEATDISSAHLMKGRKLRIVSDKDLPLNIDGEVTVSRDVTYEILERKIKIGILSLD